MARNQNTKSKSKQTRGFQKGKNRREKFDMRKENCGTDEGASLSSRRSPLNDFEWYNRNPLLTASVGAIPYPYKPGMKVPFATPNSGTSNGWTIPGIMEIEWTPTFGYSNSATDPASIVGKEIFAKVREVFSGSIDADAPDFVIYLGALDSIFAYISWLKRVYKTVTVYSPENFLFPDYLLGTYGFNFAQIDALKADRMKLFQVITELIAMTGKFRCPDVFDILNRHRWMNENVYTDSPIINSQLYVFNMQYVYKYGLSSGDAPAGMLTCTKMDFGSSTSIVDDLFAFGRELIDALANSDDAYIISGYLMRAYEGVGQFNVEQLTMGEQLIPVYVPEVLSQIENTYTINYNQDYPTVLSWNNVTQEPLTNAVICKPIYNTGAKMTDYTLNPTISIRSEVPTVIETIEASRLTTSIKSDGSIVCATEIPLRLGLNSWAGLGIGTRKVSQAMTQNTSTAVADFLTNTQVWFALTQWDWHPRIYVSNAMVNTVPGELTVLGDVHNITTLTTEQLEQIHRVCLYSEFNSFATYQ
nr:putative capsid [Marmot picobirnavirus]